MFATISKYAMVIPLIFSLVSYSGGQEIKDGQNVIKIDKASKARIEFLGGTYDFGHTPKGYTIYHDFPLRNIGTDTLIILGVKPTCGCTIAPLSNDHVAPGDTAQIEVALRTDKLEGKVRKYVNVDCSDPVNPYYKILFNAKVNSSDRFLTTDPLAVDFGDFDNGGTPEMKVAITNGGTEAVKLAVVDQNSDEFMTATLPEGKIEPNATGTLTLKLKPGIKPGFFATSITIEAPDISDSRFTLPIKGHSVK